MKVESDWVKIENDLRGFSNEISSRTGKNIDFDQVMSALFKLFQEKFDLLTISDVWDEFDEMRDYKTQIIDNLWLFEFVDFFFTNEEHGAGPFMLTKQDIKVKNRVWRMYRNDPDPFPSNPHLHCVDYGHKLNPYNGEIFDNKILIKTISKKHLNRIQAELKNKKIIL
jgi:hypothetical protein